MGFFWQRENDSDQIRGRYIWGEQDDVWDLVAGHRLCGVRAVDTQGGLPFRRRLIYAVAHG